MPSRKLTTITDGYNKLQKGSRAGLVIQGYDYSFYDTEIISNTVGTYRFFTAPIGVNGKNISDTNMKIGGSMPQGKKFTVKALKVNYIPIATKKGSEVLSIVKFYGNSVVKFLVDGKEDIGTWTLSEISGFNFPIVSDILDGDAPTDFNTTLRDNVKDHFFFNIPVELPSQQIFELEMTHALLPFASQNGDRLRLIITGYMENLQ